jgi:accessory gene regulator protein AgrB
MAGELERRGSRQPARFSRTTLGVGIIIGFAAALLVNLVVALITGLIRFAVVGTLVVVVAYFVIIGPKGRKDR